MTFLNPTIAAVGLACVAIPVIIHILMRRRRRPVQWAAMKFLMEAYQRQRRRMNLEQILLLASRCVLVALLALALGKPVLGALGALAQGPRTLYLLIDNGLASSATSPGESSSALERSKTEAINLISQLDQAQGDRVGIVALGGPSEPMVVPPSADLTAASEVVKGLKAVDSRTDLAGALSKVRDELRRTPLKAGEALWLGVLSDFRAGSTDLEASLGSLSQGEGETHLIAQSPATARLDNVAITSVEPAKSVLIATSEGGPSSASTLVHVTLRRSGAGVSQAAVSTLNIEAVGVNTSGSTTSRGPRASVTVNWGPGEETARKSLNVEVPIAAQGSRAPVTLVATIDRDAIASDNVFRRPIDTRERLEVALLVPGSVGGKGMIESYTPGDWLALALAPEADPMRRRQSGEIRVSALDPARALAPVPGSRSAAGMLGDYDAIIIPRPDLIDPAGWRLVRAAADLGSLVLICPPSTAQTHAWADAMVDGLGLEWQVAREATVYATPMALSPERLRAAGPDLLDQISAELPDLIKHVNVSQVLKVSGSAGSFEPLLDLSDGTALLVMGQPGASGADKGVRHNSRGLILFFAAAPDLKWTDLPTKPLMVPLVQELVRQGVGRSAGPRTVIAGAVPFLTAGAVELTPIEDPNIPGESSQVAAVAIDAASGRLVQPIRTQGLWAARTATGLTAGIIAYNADPAGGVMDTRSREELARWMTPVASDITWIEPGTESLTPGSGQAGSAGGTLSRDSKAPPVSFPLLIAALVVAILETGLARWFSHAKAESGLVQARESAAKGAAA